MLVLTIDECDNLGGSFFVRDILPFMRKIFFFFFKNQFVIKVNSKVSSCYFVKIIFLSVVYAMKDECLNM